MPLLLVSPTSNIYYLECPQSTTAIIYKWNLDIFELWSRLSVTFYKIQLIFLEDQNFHFYYLRILGCPKRGRHHEFLGIPIRLEKLQKEDWTCLLEKIRKTSQVSLVLYLKWEIANSDRIAFYNRIAFYFLSG